MTDSTSELCSISSSGKNQHSLTWLSLNSPVSRAFHWVPVLHRSGIWSSHLSLPSKGMLSTSRQITLVNCARHLVQFFPCIYKHTLLGSVLAILQLKSWAFKWQAQDILKLYCKKDSEEVITLVFYPKFQLISLLYTWYIPFKMQQLFYYRELLGKKYF